MISLQWLAIVAVLALGALFSAIETALFSLNASERELAGAAANRLLADKRSLLISVLFANLVTQVLYFALVHALTPHGPGYDEIAWGFGALVVLLLCSEILPKSLALRARVSVSRWGSVPMSVIVAVLAPARKIVQWMLEIVVRALGEAGRDEQGITAESLAEVLEESARHNLIEGSEADLLAEVVELEGIRVREIMTPRVDMLTLDLRAADHGEIVRTALARRLTWLPVVRGHADNVVGAVRMRDLLTRADRPVTELIDPVQFIPEVASALDLLRVLREKKRAEAVVVDEYGGTAGIVTIENVFEEIVGDLRVEGEPADRPVTPLGDGRFRVAGSLSIRDWNERFGHQVVPAGFETVGGFVTALLGRIPRAGDRVRFGGLVSQVHEVRGRRVRSVDMSIEADQRESA